MQGGEKLGDILSQSEIDELLKALNTGEIDIKNLREQQEKKVKKYDFRRASKFAKDHIKTLDIIYSNYSTLVTNYLSGYLRTLTHVSLMTVEALPYSDFSNSLSNPAIMGIVDFLPLNGSIIFEIPPGLAFSLVDRILGGKGLPMQKLRDFTEIEIAIIERILTQLLNLMREPWQNVIDIRPRLERIETNAQFAQIVSENEMIALVTFSATIGETEGMINICIPYVVLEPILPKLSTKFWFSMEKGSKGDSKNIIEKGIEDTHVSVKAQLGKTLITVKDFLELEEGDVLPLETGINDNLMVLVGELPKFFATPGVRKNKVAVKIVDVIRGEEDE